MLGVPLIHQTITMVKCSEAHRSQWRRLRATMLRRQYAALLLRERIMNMALIGLGLSLLCAAFFDEVVGAVIMASLMPWATTDTLLSLFAWYAAPVVMGALTQLAFWAGWVQSAPTTAVLQEELCWYLVLFGAVCPMILLANYTLREYLLSPPE